MFNTVILKNFGVDIGMLSRGWVGWFIKRRGEKKGKKKGKKRKKKKRFCRTKKSYCCFWTVLVKGSGYEAITTSCSATTPSDPEGILSAGYCIPFDGLSFELAILHGSFFKFFNNTLYLQ